MEFALDDGTFSVVIPTIGRPELERAIASALDQTLAPRKVIIADNGPVNGMDDRRAAVLDNKPSNLVAWLSLPPRSGPGISRNLGAWHAQTSHVAFLDDDDAFEPDYLEQIAQVVEEVDPDVLYGVKVFRSPDGSISHEKNLDRYPREEWLQRLLSQKNHGFGGQNVVVRREVFIDLGGFPPDLRIAEDRGFAIAVLRAGRSLAYVPGARVNCHPPSGYRAKYDSSQWLSYLKILIDNWSEMTWRTRRTSVRKTLKSMAAHTYKRIRHGRKKRQTTRGRVPRNAAGNWWPEQTSKRTRSSSRRRRSTSSARSSPSTNGR